MIKNLFKNEVSLIKPYVPGKPVEELEKELGIKNIEKLILNENPLGPSKAVVEAIKKEAENIHIYPDANCMKLKVELAKKYSLVPENIVVGNGGEQIIKIIADTFINPGDEAIMATTTFGKYESEVCFTGGVAVKLELKNYKHDFKGFIEKITDKTKLIFICNPNNPTGNIMTKDEVNYLVKNVPDDIVIVFDEAYYDYAIRNSQYPETIDILKQRSNTIILRTFSKVSGIAALRVGFALTSKEIASQMNKVRGTFNVNRLAQVAAIAALKDNEHTEKTVELNYMSIDIMEKYFEERNLDYIKSNANFVFVNVNMDSRIVSQNLLKKGILITPGHLWGWNSWIRVSTGTIEQTEKFIDKLKEVLDENKIYA